MKTTGWLILSLAASCAFRLLTSAIGATVTFGSGANTFNIEFVPIGNPGNAG